MPVTLTNITFDRAAEVGCALMYDLQPSSHQADVTTDVSICSTLDTSYTVCLSIHFVCMCVLKIYVHIMYTEFYCVYAYRPEEGAISAHRMLGTTMWLLEVEIWTSGRRVSALNF